MDDLPPIVEFVQVLDVESIDLMGEEVTTITLANEIGDELEALTFDRPQLLRLLAGLDELPNPVGYRARFAKLATRLETLAISARLIASNAGEDPATAAFEISANDLERIIRDACS
jgi:hypothetical protein